MNKDLEKAKSLLDESNRRTCVFVADNINVSTDERGVAPLLDFLTCGIDWRKYSAADKVVGRAAAFIYVKMGIKELYARTVSKSAVEVLTKYNVKFSYGELVETIKNRNGDGVCPMEQATTGIDDPNTALTAIKAKLKSLQDS